MAEILLAIALITVVLLTLMGLNMHTLQSNRKTMDTGAGQMLAEQVLEQIADSAEASNTAPVWGWNSAVLAYSSDPVVIGGTTLQVTTYATDVTALSAPFFGANKRLKRLRTQVIWKDLAQGKMGYGQLQVQASRLVHEP